MTLMASSRERAVKNRPRRAGARAARSASFAIGSDASRTSTIRRVAAMIVAYGGALLAIQVGLWVVALRRLRTWRAEERA